MAVNDVVVGINAAVNTILDYQPASGVETLITSIFYLSGDGAPVFYNGTNQSQYAQGATTIMQPYITQYFVTNTTYLRLVASSTAKNAYSGVQTK